MCSFFMQKLYSVGSELRLLISANKFTQIEYCMLDFVPTPLFLLKPYIHSIRWKYIRIFFLIYFLLFPNNLMSLFFKVQFFFHHILIHLEDQIFLLSKLYHLVYHCQLTLRYFVVVFAVLLYSIQSFYVNKKEFILLSWDI